MSFQAASPTSLVPLLSRTEEATQLHALLEDNPELSRRQRMALVASIMQHDPAVALRTARPSLPASGPAPADTHVLLSPGMVQAEALAINYALILALNVPAALQDTLAPPQTILLGSNYMVLSALMLLLSTLCCAQAFVRRDLRAHCRAVSIAMAATGVFGLLECVAFTAPDGLLQVFRPLFFVGLPLLSFLIGLRTVLRGFLHAA